MTLNISRQITALGRMTPKELRSRYAAVFGEPTRSGNKEFLIKRIAWRLQSQAEGGLSDRARRRAEQLAREGVEVTVLGVDREGGVDPADVEAAVVHELSHVLVAELREEVDDWLKHEARVVTMLTRAFLTARDSALEEAASK